MCHLKQFLDKMFSDKLVSNNKEQENTDYKNIFYPIEWMKRDLIWYLFANVWG